MISNRLRNIVDLVVEDNNIADIGSDHGYVLISLRNKGFKSKLLGVENKLAPFKNLESNLKESKINNVDVSLSDGLQKVPSDYKTIIIAGMGFETIQKIIEESKQSIDSIDYFIIDSHTSFQKVRPYFISLGFIIDEEKIIYEDSIYYQLIRFKKDNVKREYTNAELAYGPLNIKRKDNMFKDFIRNEISQKMTIIDKIPSTNGKALKLKSEIKELEELLWIQDH